MTRKIAAIAVAGLLLLSAGWSLYAAAGKEAAGRNRPILFVPKSVGDHMEFWEVMNQGVFTAAREFNTVVRVEGTDTETNVEGQIRLLENAIAQKPKPRAIILAASDYRRVVPAAQAIVRSGIKLITVDSELSGDLSSSFIATDNYEAGRKAGDTMRRWVGSDANVAIVSFVKGSGTAIDRERGVRDSLKPYAGIRLSDTYFSDGSAEKAYAIVSRLIRDDPSLSGVIGLNEPTVVGAARAIRDADKTSQVKLVGFDSSMDEIAFLEEGVLQATVVQKPFNMGYLAVKTALAVLDGEKVDQRIDTGSEIVTRDNMYSSENQKLLFPFEEK